MTEMAQYPEELVRASVLLDAAGLWPTSEGWQIRCSVRKRTLTDGPFAKTQELLAGYPLVKVSSREDAIERARRGPSPAGEGKNAELVPAVRAGAVRARRGCRALPADGTRSAAIGRP